MLDDYYSAGLEPEGYTVRTISGDKPTTINFTGFIDELEEYQTKKKKR